MARQKLTTPPPNARRRVGSCRLQRVDCFDKLKERASRKRRGEHVTLRGAHAKRPQMHHLLEILDAFGHHIHAHVARKIDERFDDGGGIAVRADSIHEHLVDLDDVDPEREHVGKPAVPGATTSIAIRTPRPCKAVIVCRVSVKFSIGSRSVPSSTTCENLIGELAKMLRTSLTIVKLAEQLAGKIERDSQIRAPAN